MIDEYRPIPLTRDQFAKVSPHRFDDINRFKWHALWSPGTNSFYARRTVCFNGRPQKVYMHRFILGLEHGDKRMGDHRDHDTLNNTDENLRIATVTQQNRNRRPPKHNTSGFVGTVWLPVIRLWQARIYVDGRCKYLGCRETAEAAYRELYVPAALEHHGEFACL